LRDQVLIVPSPALEWLTAERVSFTLLESLHHDDVVQTLRNHLTHAVQ